LPGKPLRDIAGKTMIERVYRQARLSSAARVLVATDDERIVAAATGFGGEAVLTSASHPSGTDRLAEVARQLDLGDDDIVVNVQGDEPLIPPAVIDQVAANLAANLSAGVATLCEPVTSVQTLLDANVVKVIADASEHAMYFSRAPIPWSRDHFADSHTSLPKASLPKTSLPKTSLPKTSLPKTSLPKTYAYRRHIGLYAYRVKLLHEFVDWPVADLEKTEALEQLRFMYHGVKIHIAEAVEAVPPGVDTEEDLQAVVRLLASSSP